VSSRLCFPLIFPGIFWTRSGANPPPYIPYIYDTTAFAYLVHPEFATDVRDLWVDMNTTFDANYGKYEAVHR
jgi:hypothetical protein